MRKIIPGQCPFTNFTNVKMRRFIRVSYRLMDLMYERKISFVDLKVYLTLARFVYFKGRRFFAFPSTRKIATISKLYQSSICKSIKKLEAVGLITVYQRPRGYQRYTNIYILNEFMVLEYQDYIRDFRSYFRIKMPLDEMIQKFEKSYLMLYPVIANVQEEKKTSEVGTEAIHEL